MRPGDPAVVVANTFSPGDFVAYAVAKDNQPLVDALNSGLDAVIADGTWAQLYSQWVPRTLPPRLETRVASRPRPDTAGLRRDRREPPPQAGGPVRAEVHSGAVARFLFRLGHVPASHPRSVHHRAAQHADPDQQRASSSGWCSAWRWRSPECSHSRWLRWPARVYTDIFRGLPEVVIILIIGHGHRAAGRRTDATTIPTRWALPRWG